MASFNKFNSFVEGVAHGDHDLENNSLVVALTNTAPVATNSLLAHLTEISYTNLSSRALTVSGSSQTSGTYKLTIEDLVLTASGGSVGPFRYVVIYDDTATNDPLIGFYDYGSSITLADGETLTIDFDDSNGVLTIV